MKKFSKKGYLLIIALLSFITLVLLATLIYTVQQDSFVATESDAKSADTYSALPFTELDLTKIKQSDLNTVDILKATDSSKASSPIYSDNSTLYLQGISTNSPVSRLMLLDMPANKTYLIFGANKFIRNYGFRPQDKRYALAEVVTGTSQSAIKILDVKDRRLVDLSPAVNDNSLFTFAMWLRDGSGIAVCIRDSANNSGEGKLHFYNSAGQANSRYKPDVNCLFNGGATYSNDFHWQLGNNMPDSPFHNTVKDLTNGVVKNFDDYGVPEPRFFLGFAPDGRVHYIGLNDHKIYALNPATMQYQFIRDTGLIFSSYVDPKSADVPLDGSYSYLLLMYHGSATVYRYNFVDELRVINNSLIVYPDTNTLDFKVSTDGSFATYLVGGNSIARLVMGTSNNQIFCNLCKNATWTYGSNNITGTLIH